MYVLFNIIITFHSISKWRGNVRYWSFSIVNLRHTYRVRLRVLTNDFWNDGEAILCCCLQIVEMNTFHSLSGTCWQTASSSEPQSDQLVCWPLLPVLRPTLHHRQFKPDHHPCFFPCSILFVASISLNPPEKSSSYSIEPVGLPSFRDFREIGRTSLRRRAHVNGSFKSLTLL